MLNKQSPSMKLLPADTNEVRGADLISSELADRTQKKDFRVRKPDSRVGRRGGADATPQNCRNFTDVVTKHIDEVTLGRALTHRGLC